MKVSSRWEALALIFIFMLAFAITFQSIPPLFSFLVSSLGISHAQAGALMSLFALPGIFISIPLGVLIDAYGAKLVGITALVVTFCGSLLVGLGLNFPLLVTGRIIAGTGALTISIVAPQMLSGWFANKELGIAMGVFNMAMPLGTILTLNTFGIMATNFGWRMPLLFTTVYCLLVLILLSFKFPSLPHKEQQTSLRENLRGLKSTGWSIWLVAMIWMMYNASSISYLTFVGDYYESLGYGVSFSGFLTSLFMIGALIFSPLVGSLTDKFGKEEYFMFGGSIAMTILLLLIPRTNLNPLIFGSLIGIFAATVPAPVFSLVPNFLKPRQLGLGYGILSTCLNFGVLIGPLLVGFSYDKTANYLAGFNLMALFALLTAIIALLLKLTSSRADKANV